MRNFLFLLAPLVLAACGADVEAACQSYFDAIETCANEYGDANDLDASSFLPADTYCDVYAGSSDKASADLLNCQADVYSNADCATTEGWSAAGTASTACAAN